MALPPLATVTDLAGWVGDTIADADARALAVLRAASALVRAYTGQDWLDATDPTVADPPDAVHVVTLAVAGRAWQRPGDVESTTETAGPFGETRRYVGDGGSLYLTKTDKLMLAPHRTRTTGVSVLSTTRGEEPHAAWYPVEGTTMPFPLYAADESLP